MMKVAISSMKYTHEKVSEKGRDKNILISISKNTTDKYSLNVFSNMFFSLIIVLLFGWFCKADNRHNDKNGTCHDNKDLTHGAVTTHF